MPLREAVAEACRVRLRPILMTSLATIFGLLPMALKLGTGCEAYAPLARAIIGGLSVSVVLTMFLVPAAFLSFIAVGRSMRKQVLRIHRVRVDSRRFQQERPSSFSYSFCPVAADNVSPCQSIT